MRETGEWRRGHLEGAIHIPLNEVPLRLAELPSALAIVCYCHTGQRSARAQEFLCRHHFPQVYNLEGGIVAWGQTPGARIVTE
ncbi:MAG: putative adenylyltransferase/sulfurtransferase MoeZ [Verrucomicrobia bacterium ADurb.Bin474]|nr:MAG: putative adenylyltransferase/sulfurtransferase MoeZ [Verrucomicrobia bacterium ADurb.Bin474]